MTEQKVLSMWSVHQKMILLMQRWTTNSQNAQPSFFGRVRGLTGGRHIEAPPVRISSGLLQQDDDDMKQDNQYKKPMVNTKIFLLGT